LTGSGRIAGYLGGGFISAGDSAGILTAGSIITGSTNPSAFAFELGHPGLPDFAHPNASGNDLVRLTDPAAPFNLSLGASNVISLYFQANTLLPGDEFAGGFFTDLRADFTAAVESATYHVYLLDPDGSVLFGGATYSPADDLDVAISTAPISADFGAGAVDGQIMEIQVVPEPSSAALLWAGIGMAGLIRARRGGLAVAA
jgi:hypothetical protein